MREIIYYYLLYQSLKGVRLGLFKIDVSVTISIFSNIKQLGDDSLNSKSFSIGFNRIESKWIIVYGSTALVEHWITKIVTNGRIYSEAYKSEEKMNKQLEYYKMEYENVSIHRVEDIVKEIA